MNGGASDFEWRVLRGLAYAINPILCLLGVGLVIRGQSLSGVAIGATLAIAGAVNLLAVIEADRGRDRGSRGS